MQGLGLNSNQLTGSRPQTLKPGSLQVLYLNINQLIGLLPPRLCKLGNLPVLYSLSDQLIGSPRRSLGSLAAYRGMT